MKLKLNAYAKINLYLDIVSRLDNGFHEIESIMQTVSLCDTVSICAYESAHTDIKISCSSDYAPEGEKNIAYKAAMAYLECANLNARVEIDVEKNIPSPAGMAGGSADAAAVLRGLNEIFGRISDEELLKLSANVGSDVPFCVHGGTSVVGGRGEKLTGCDPIADCFMVVACGKDKMPTPLAFKMLDDKYGDFSQIEHNMSDFVSKLTNIKEMPSAMYNIFEQVTPLLCPSVEEIKHLMRACGALGAMMSGSGPSVFGIFDDEMKANEASNNIKTLGMFSAVTKPAARY